MKADLAVQQVTLFPGMTADQEAYALESHKTIHIAPTGDVQLSRLEVDIIDTGSFQRLRRIRELGTTYLVYPTALHTRFDHSLGTLGMAQRMVAAVRGNVKSNETERAISPEQEVLIRLYALLHDIGHIPFGHTLEDELRLLPRHDEDQPRLQGLLGRGSEIGERIVERIGLGMYEEFMGLVRTRKETVHLLGDSAFVYDMVSNTVCADLLDYLPRDCFFCGLAVDDGYRFLDYLYLTPEVVRVTEGGSEKSYATKRVAIRLWKPGKPSPRPDLLSELARLLDDRYRLGERVYFHRAKLASGAMLGAAVYDAVQRKKLETADMYSMGDDELLHRLSTMDGLAKVLADSLLRRRLHKLAWTRTREDVIADQKQSPDRDVMGETMALWHEDPAERRRAETFIADAIGAGPGDVLIHCPGESMALKPAEMKVLWSGKIRPLRECSDDVVKRRLKSTLEAHRHLWSIRVFVSKAFSGKRTELEDACTAIFSFNTLKRDAAYAATMRRTFHAIVRGEKLAEDPEGLMAAEEQFVETMLLPTQATRSQDEIRQAIREILNGNSGDPAE